VLLYSQQRSFSSFTKYQRSPPPLQGLVYPLDTVRTRLAVCHSSEYGGIWQTAVRLARTEGYAAFYRGLVPSMVSRCACGGRAQVGLWCGGLLPKAAAAAAAAVWQ